jgi:hypothetical protein
VRRPGGVRPARHGHQRKEVDASIKQIYGADRCLSSATHEIRNDGSLGLALPPGASRKGAPDRSRARGRGQVPHGSGDAGKEFVHVMNQESFTEVLNELDTIPDLTEYLAATEACAEGGCSIVMGGSKADLLGLQRRPRTRDCSTTGRWARRCTGGIAPQVYGTRTSCWRCDASFAGSSVASPASATARTLRRIPGHDRRWA